MRASFLASKYKSMVLNPHSWIIAGLFAVISVSHYHEPLQNVPIIGQISTSVFFGLGRHTGDRLIYILIIAYSSWIFGTKAGRAVLLASFLTMLPRAIFISPSPTDALFETFTTSSVGVLLVSFVGARHKVQVAMAILRSSEERYRELFQNASDAIWTHDLNGNITAANRACETMTGYSVDELLGMNVRQFLSEDARALASTVKSKLLQGEPVKQRYEQRVFRRDGTEAILELTTRLITQNDEPTAFQNTARDVTEQKRAEEAVRESERELAQIVEGSSVATFVIDNKHTITHWNKACENLTSVPASEVVGTMRQWSAFYAEERPVMADLMVDSVPEGEIARHYGSKYGKSGLIEGAYEAEDFFPQFGESGKWLFFTAAPLKDHEGKVFGAIETLQDITERKQADEALKESERRYRELFDSASDAIFIRDLEGQIVEVNQAASDLTGYEIDELVRMNIRQFLTAESFKIVVERQQRQLEGEANSQRYELEIIRKDGTRAIIDAAIRLINENGKPVGVQAMVRDVTEERKMRDSMSFYLQKVLVAQEEERKRIARDLHDDASQSLLLLIHRLDAIVSDPEIACSQPLQEKLTQLRSLGVNILDGLRRYARELRPAILDDMGLVAALEWMADSLIAEDGVDVDVQVGGQSRDLPHEAELTLFRIAQEALRNIRKHAGASKVVMRLESEAEQIRMVVTDDGKGFEVPLQLTDLRGTGKLGLMGMQERAQLLGGSLSIQSELGKGTTVIIEIPRELGFRPDV